MINEAQAYRNRIIPEANGIAAQLRAEAEAYKEQVVARADGAAQRFVAVYDQVPGRQGRDPAPDLPRNPRAGVPRHEQDYRRQRRQRRRSGGPLSTLPEIQNRAAEVAPERSEPMNNMVKIGAIVAAVVALIVLRLAMFTGRRARTGAGAPIRQARCGSLPSPACISKCR